MNGIDRSIAFARTRDGCRISHFGHHVVVDGTVADVCACTIDPQECDGGALAAWARWCDRVPIGQIPGLMAECGAVCEGQWSRTYTVVHLNGAILEIDGESFDYPLAAYELEWSLRPQGAAVVLGPSAVLALVDFAIDGVLASRWLPAGVLERLSIVDTPHSPYPPQHRANGAPRPVGTGNPGVIDDATFLLLQRSERWQRPLNALYNINRRNLSVSHSTVAEHPSVAVVIDALVAEGEPTIAASNWIGTWHLQSPDGRCWGRRPLAINLHVSELLEAADWAVSPPRAACICDPIEGEIFGLAPSLLVKALPSATTLDEVRS
ncbi:hypothetical protein NLM16_27675 [Bradyrhizobium brasilense]|uniref:hypothetical protein n=1 Tax=Bradyrhizobium brasilense TaxID=1419277 RepID=UPI002877DFB4|nr:hypothetical protein [Bradyrhizobium brasilense]MCP3417893.1 hypothetical protein [Bradyrhizobium brasilense]